MQALIELWNLLNQMRGKRDEEARGVGVTAP
jgi:hypothetical protein